MPSIGAALSVKPIGVIVFSHPGIAIPEIAEKMGIKQNYLYRVLPGLADDGLVEKDGRGWRPKSAA
jgi:DNA-binding IclR family transcriptional regulator